MKTNNFKKRIWVIMASALLCCCSAKAQNTKGWSIIPFARIGHMLDGTIWMDETYHVDAGVDAKVSFNEHWSLLTGLEYDYRWGFNREGSWMFPGDHREGLQHFIRIPVRAEFTHKWFYADAGLFVERATNTHYNANKTMDFGIGSEVELGGRIRLSENDHLRIGAQVRHGSIRAGIPSPCPWASTSTWGRPSRFTPSATPAARLPIIVSIFRVPIIRRNTRTDSTGVQVSVCSMHITA